LKTRILYIEDEPSLGKIVKETLQNQGFDVDWRKDGAQVLGALSRFQPDICVVDIMLPNIDGYTLCKEIRKQHPALPVIFLTAKTETQDLVKGFEAGGTDYIRKPFSMEELIARIHNQLRISGPQTKDETALPDEIILGKYILYPKLYELHSLKKIIKLSQRDMELLGMLAFKRNKIADRKEILLKIWGDDSFFNSRTLDVYIRKLRNYFHDDPAIEIVTLKGKGYLFLVK